MAQITFTSSLQPSERLRKVFLGAILIEAAAHNTATLADKTRLKTRKMNMVQYHEAEHVRETLREALWKNNVVETLVHSVIGLALQLTS